MTKYEAVVKYYAEDGMETVSVQCDGFDMYSVDGVRNFIFANGVRDGKIYHRLAVGTFVSAEIIEMEEGGERHDEP